MEQPATRLLIVEDEDTVRSSMAAYLEDSGYDVLQAADGRDGLQVFQRERPDVVLSDLSMPEMDGRALLAALRQAAPETPFIVVSGTGDVAAAVETLRQGAWDFITKPVHDLAVVEHAVQRALERVRLLQDNRRYEQHLADTNQRLEQSLRQLEQEEGAARRIQFQLLPPPSLEIHGCRFAHRIVTSQFLSGDFVDYFPIDDARAACYLADVSGHGVSSALVTVLLKTTIERLLSRFRAGESDMLLHPAQVLRQLNHELIERDIDKYLTIFYGVVDRAAHTLAYANGGHFPQPVLCDAAGARELACTGTPPGLFEAAVYEQVVAPLADRFSLAVFTDGVLEACTMDHGPVQKDDLARIVCLPPVPMAQVAERLGLDRVSEPLDDVTVLLVTREG